MNQAEYLAKSMDAVFSLMEDPSLPLSAQGGDVPPRQFYSTPSCYRCGFSLVENTPQWWEKTSCPKCRRSFVD